MTSNPDVPTVRWLITNAKAQVDASVPADADRLATTAGDSVRLLHDLCEVMSARLDHIGRQCLPQFKATVETPHILLIVREDAAGMFTHPVHGGQSRTLMWELRHGRKAGVGFDVDLAVLRSVPTPLRDALMTPNNEAWLAAKNHTRLSDIELLYSVLTQRPAYA